MESNDALVSLSALSQSTRFAVFRLLVEAGRAGLPVAEIGASVPSSPATMSFHLKELVHAGLITPRQDGRQIFYSADYQRMNDLLGFLTENCCARDASSCSPDGCGDADVSKSRIASRREQGSHGASRTVSTKDKSRKTGTVTSRERGSDGVSRTFSTKAKARKTRPATSLERGPHGVSRTSSTKAKTRKRYATRKSRTHPPTPRGPS